MHDAIIAGKWIDDIGVLSVEISSLNLVVVIAVLLVLYIKLVDALIPCIDDSRIRVYVSGPFEGI